MNKHKDGQEFEPVRPGTDFGKRKARGYPKGRQVQPEALAQIRDLLGSRPRRADLLIEHLHLIQDAYGHISAPHLAALAYEMRLAMAEVFEVATFYHHFDVVKEGESPPPEITVRVCESLSCALQGSADLYRTLKKSAPAHVRVVHAPCMGLCDKAPAAAIKGHYTGPVSVAALTEIAETRSYPRAELRPKRLADYRQSGGYKTWQGLKSGGRSPDDVISVLTEAGLRGLGGAGFPSGKKWQFVRAGGSPRYLCINGDEGEPGTFKDKHYLETNPHQFLEGALIAAWGVEAKAIYIYIRDEYPDARRILAEEIEGLEQAGIVPTGYVHLRRGAGAYICGEESAMIESIEGKRGLPRHRPPFVAQVGLFGRPTLEHNVETVYWIPEILRRGAEWFAAQGKPGHKGPRSYSVSGRVKRPGVIVAPAGTTAKELIELAGGMADGHRFKGYLPGGASGGILPASMGDLPLDFGQLEKYGCFVGSHAVVILSETDDMRDVAVNLMAFFKEESCGQCTPCRVGCEKALGLMTKPKWDAPLLGELSAAMSDASICGLGQAAPNPLRSVLKFFSEEVT